MKLFNNCRINEVCICIQRLSFLTLLIFILAGTLLLGSGLTIALQVEASETRSLGSLDIGDRVVDLSWEWIHRTGDNWQGTEGEGKPVIWIVVAKNHSGYPANSVTLLSEQLIGKYRFDSYNFDHWGDSGNQGPDGLGLRPWLNSEYPYDDYGLYDYFSTRLKNSIILTTVPNRTTGGVPYTTEDEVFIPSDTELNGTPGIGTVYEYFNNADEQDRKATIGADFGRFGGEYYHYWTRSPSQLPIPEPHYVKIVTDQGGFADSMANEGSVGVRPVINLSAETSISIELVDGFDNVYEISAYAPPPSLHLPSDNLNISGSQIDFSWSKSPLFVRTFHLQVSMQSDFSETFIDDDYIRPVDYNSTATYTGEGFPDDGTTFYWRARTKEPDTHGGNWGHWSQPISFINGNPDTPFTSHLYASFADAVYVYDGTDWINTPVAHAPALALHAPAFAVSTFFGNLYGAFEDGVYVYDGTSWDPEKITSGVASSLATFAYLNPGMVGLVHLYGSFEDATYVYDGNTWTQFTWLTTALAADKGFVGLLYASFADAVYAYNGYQWLDDPIAHAPALALATHEGNLYGAFEDGIYVYDGTSWDPEKITSGVASSLAFFNDQLYGSFTDATYVYDDNQWILFTYPTTALAVY